MLSMYFRQLKSNQKKFISIVSLVVIIGLCCSVVESFDCKRNPQ